MPTQVARGWPPESLRRLHTTLSAYLQLVRLPQVAVVLGGSLVGARLAAFGNMPVTALALVAVANALLFGASMAFNDWHDVLEDSVNQPSRPLPAGLVSRQHALLFALALFACAIALSSALGPKMATLAVIVSALSIVYTLRAKRVPWLGNALVAAVSAYPLWCWLGLDARPSQAFTALIVGCFVFRIGAEVVKTGEDYLGDRSAGIPTVATRWGSAAANRAGAALMCAALVLLLCLPHGSSIVSAGLLVCSLLSAAASLWVVCTHDARHDHSRWLVRVGRTIMVVMLGVLLFDAQWH